jgi:hypothetical protein
LTSDQRALLTRWLFVFLVTTLLFVVLAFVSPEKYNKAWAYFIGTFFLGSNLFMLIVARSVLNPLTKNANGILGAIALKQMASMVFIMIYLFKFYQNDLWEIAICVGTYLVYSIIAWGFGYRFSK